MEKIRKWEYMPKVKHTHKTPQWPRDRHRIKEKSKTIRHIDNNSKNNKLGKGENLISRVSTSLDSNAQFPPTNHFVYNENEQ